MYNIRVLKTSVGVGTLRVGPRGRRYVQEALLANRLSYGPFTRRFEALFARLHGCRHAAFCNSGTSALHVALQALKEKYRWKDGDEVLVPAVSFVATANVVLHNRLSPVFVDVRQDTYNVNPELIERKITRRTRAVIPVHLMGLPAEMPAILAIARRRGLKVIEDSCEAMFVKSGGRPVGSMGDVGCFSTYAAHYVTTGVGGLATTRDADLDARLRSLMNHGRDPIYLSMDDSKRGAGREKVVDRRFRFLSAGHSFRATEMEAALGLAQLEDWRSILAARRAVAQDYLRGLADLDGELQLPRVPPGQEHAFMLFPLAVRRAKKRALVHFLERRGVETRDLMPLINQPVYRRMFGNLDKKYPAARWINERGFYVGCHQDVSPVQRRHVVETIRRFFR